MEDDGYDDLYSGRGVILIDSNNTDKDEEYCLFELTAAEVCQRNPPLDCTCTMSITFSQDIERQFGEVFSSGGRMLQNMGDDYYDTSNVTIGNSFSPNQTSFTNNPFYERPPDQKLEELQNHQESCRAANDKICEYVKESSKCCCQPEITAYTECAYNKIYPEMFNLPSACTHECYEASINTGLISGIIVGVVIAALYAAWMRFFVMPRRKESLFLKNPITTKHTSTGGNIGNIQNIKGDFNLEFEFGLSSMQGWRSKMEDRHIAMVNNETEYAETGVFPPNHALFCVMDGHGGTSVSDYASKNLVRMLCQENIFLEYVNQLNLKDQRSAEELNNLFGLLKLSLEHAFVDLDLDMLRGETRAKKENNNFSLMDKIRMKFSTEIKGNPAPGVTEKEKSGDIEEMYENSRNFGGEQGSTVVLIMLTPHFIICSNLGDSRAVLCCGGARPENLQMKALPLSTDHKPDLPEEKERIQRAGGIVKSNKRIKSAFDNKGSLSVSRALGDFNYKEYHPINKEETGMQVACRVQVTPVPECTVRTPSFERDRFIVLACDGIWDVLSNEECVNLITELFEEGESDLGLICEEVLDICLEKKSRDNMSIILLKFPSQPIGEGEGVAGRRKQRSPELTPSEKVIVA